MTEPIFFSEGADPEMELASAHARKTFPLFWRELSWEMRRIIPGLDIGAVKRGFPTNAESDDIPAVELMWVDEISFDGVTISGILLNEPSYVDDLEAGDDVQFGLSDVADWMYATAGRVYGGFSVQAMRQKMSKRELKDHDAAWGLDFGDPKAVYVAPNLSFATYSSTSPIDLPEHPMSENMTEKIRESLEEMGAAMNEPMFSGMTMLQFESLAGNFTPVRLLLEHGADKTLKTANGHTALDLAEIMNWQKIVNALRA